MSTLIPKQMNDAGAATGNQDSNERLLPSYLQTWSEILQPSGNIAFFTRDDESSMLFFRADNSGKTQAIEISIVMQPEDVERLLEESAFD